jgi:hypothetical protein
MREIYTILISLLIGNHFFSQGLSCTDADLTPTDTVITSSLTGSNQHYFYINKTSSDSVKVTIQSTTACGVKVENLTFSSSQNGSCVPLNTTNQIISNSTPNCVGDSTVSFSIPANEFSYFRIYRNAAPAPETYTLTIESISATTSIKPSERAEEISIFPNPSNDVFNIKGVKGTWHVFDALGKQCLSGQQSVVDLAKFPIGLYTLKTKAGNTFKLLKQ